MKKHIAIALLVGFGLGMPAFEAQAQGQSIQDDGRPFDQQLGDACSTDPAGCATLLQGIPGGGSGSALAKLALESILNSSGLTTDQKVSMVGSVASSGRIGSLDLLGYRTNLGRQQVAALTSGAPVPPEVTALYAALSEGMITVSGVRDNQQSSTTGGTNNLSDEATQAQSGSPG